MERTSRSTKDLIVDLAITHCDEEGAWLITSAERQRLMQLIARNMPAVPSTLADAILNSKWLNDHDAGVKDADV